jgi:hypothetical protein
LQFLESVAIATDICRVGITFKYMYIDVHVLQYMYCTGRAWKRSYTTRGSFHMQFHE